MILTGLLTWRAIKRGVLPNPTVVYLVITAIAVASILFGSHDGGQLVYQYGAGTSVQPAATQETRESEEQSNHQSGNRDRSINLLNSIDRVQPSVPVRLS